MPEVRYSQGLGDLDIDLDKEEDLAPEADTGEGDSLPDIPVEGDDSAEESNEETSPEEAGGDLPDFGQEEPKDLGIGSDANEGLEKAKDLEKQVKVDKIVNEIDKVSLETEVLTLKTQLGQLVSENSVLYNRLEDLKRQFQDHVLYRIPKYQEMELPGSKYNPQYIVPHIASALDKIFINVFSDVPKYDFRSFEIIDKDDEGNIDNAMIRVDISFDDRSPFKFLKFDMELFIISGYLQVPQWFTYDRKLYTLNQEGVRKLEMVGNMLDRDDLPHMNNYRQVNWMNMNRENKNTVIPHQVDMPQTMHNQNDNLWSPKKSF